jgi:hypothetical protein
MSSLIKIEEYKESDRLIDAFEQQFQNGCEQINVVRGNRIVGVMVSREVAEQMLARKVAEHWISNPDVIDDLRESLAEEPEDWD